MFRSAKGMFRTAHDADKYWSQHREKSSEKIRHSWYVSLFMKINLKYGFGFSRIFIIDDDTAILIMHSVLCLLKRSINWTIESLLDLSALLDYLQRSYPRKDKSYRPHEFIIIAIEDSASSVRKYTCPGSTRTSSPHSSSLAAAAENVVQNIFLTEAARAPEDYAGQLEVF